MDPAVLSAIRAGISKVKSPGGHDKVYKDECIYTFDSPYSPTGLHVNLGTWHGVSKDFLEFDSRKSGSTLYLHLKYEKVPIPQDAEDDGKTGEPTKLAIGVEGGFKLDTQKYEVFKTYSLVVLRGEGVEPAVVPWPNAAIPEFVGRACEAIINHQGAAVMTDVAAWADDDVRPISKYADSLPQLDNCVKILNDPSTWKCADSGETQNLWLNLSTGYIGSGRKQYIAEGVTIGTGAALRHFQETGQKYPLVVKLGTITPSGADVYSYAPDEDYMVTDPKLGEHLSHWGINMMKLDRTDKTLVELEIEVQKNWSFSRITEAGSKLVPLRGPGFVGLRNLGNSCYMNSVVQLLMTIPELRAQYLDRYDALVRERAVADPPSDVLVQTSKLAMGLYSERYAPPATLEEAKAAADTADADHFTTSIEPRMFKALIGRGHQDFSSSRQQDAGEYLQHLVELLLRAERVGMGGAYSTESLFRFELEERLQCVESGQVKYQGRTERWVRLDIPVEKAVNRQEVQEYQERKLKRQKLDEGVSSSTPMVESESVSGAAGTLAPAPGIPAPKAEDEPEVLPNVPFEACLERWAADETIEDWYSSALKRRGVAVKHNRFKTFPRYLVFELKRYFYDESWQPRKLEATVEMPEVLDLTSLKGSGPREGEVLLPDDDGASAAPSSSAAATGPEAVPPNSSMAEQMAPFGFSSNAISRALIAVSNASVEAATQWLFEHMEDPDINEPLPSPQPVAGAGAQGAAPPNPEMVSNLAAMLGFTEAQASAALMSTGGDMERAADWLFAHADDMDVAVASVTAQHTQGGGASSSASSGGTADEMSDGEGKYELLGFLSHVGKNTGSGHYVAHIKKNGRWTIFDDQKVALSERPPRELGYIYFYVRQDNMQL